MRDTGIQLKSSTRPFVKYSPNACRAPGLDTNREHRLGVKPALACVKKTGGVRDELEGPRYLIPVVPVLGTGKSMVVSWMK